MNCGKVAVLAIVVGALCVVLDLAPAFFVGWVVSGELPGWLPGWERTVTTVTVYNYLAGAAASLATALLSVGLGYVVARGSDVPGEFRRLGATVAAGSALGIAVSFLLVAFLGNVGLGGATSDPGPVPLFLTLTALVRMVVSVGLVVTGGALVGAALSHFDGHSGQRSQPAD